MDVVERELVQIRVLVPLRIDVLLAIRRAVQHVLVEAGVAGRPGLCQVARVRVVRLVVARVPLRDLVFVVQVPGVLVPTMRPALGVLAMIVVVVLVPRVVVEMVRPVLAVPVVIVMLVPDDFVVVMITIAVMIAIVMIAPR